MAGGKERRPVRRLESVSNRVIGKVVAIHQGLSRTTVRLVVGSGAELRSRWALEIGAAPVRIGEYMQAEIGAGSVLLAHPSFRVGKERWNRWTGRIVLVEHQEPVTLVTVKIHGENWTLQSVCGVLGSSEAPRTWDSVNIVVDPEAVRLSCEPAEHVSRGALWSAPGGSAATAGRVFMKGRVQSVRLAPSGTLVTCEVGRAVVSALLEAVDGALCRWGAGMVVELSVGESEAWIKPCEGDVAAIRCDLLYLTPEGDVRGGVSSGARLQAEACRSLLLGK